MVYVGELMGEGKNCEGNGEWCLVRGSEGRKEWCEGRERGIGITMFGGREVRGEKVSGDSRLW